MMKTASWATLAALMWSGAAFGQENLEVQSTNLLLDFEGKSVLYTIQGASQITVAQYVTQTDIESNHDYDNVGAFGSGDTSTAGWRGCTGQNMCIDSSETGSDGAGNGGSETATHADAYTYAVRKGPGNWHTEGVVSDESQRLFGYAQQCAGGSSGGLGSGFTDAACGALNAGSRLIWVKNGTMTGPSVPTWAGNTGLTGGSAYLNDSVEFTSTAGTGAPEPDLHGSTTGASAMLALYDFTYSGEFRVNYDLVVELSVQHQSDGQDKRFRLFQVIWGHDSDDAGGSDETLSVSTGDGTGGPDSLWTKSDNDN